MKKVAVIVLTEETTGICQTNDVSIEGKITKDMWNMLIDKLLKKTWKNQA